MKSPDSPGIWQRKIEWSNGTSVSEYNVIKEGDRLKWWNFDKQDWFYADWFEEIPQITWEKIK